MSSNRRIKVLLTNDDGPPGPESPYIYGLYRHLSEDLGWDVKVVIPSSQKSWIGKAYEIKQIIHGRFYYPRGPDGAGEVSETPRPLREGEVAEWVLLDGTPATCANIGLHNIYGWDEVDLLISGPNLGRNSSAAFALSSGTIGAALSSSLSKTRSIALSYGTVIHPTPPEFFEPAHQLSSRIIRYLWNNWDQDKGGIRHGEVDLYNVNIPMIQALLSEEGIRVCWTTIWRNSYGRLFKPHAHSEPSTSAAGPDADIAGDSDAAGEKRLIFKFGPDMSGILEPRDSPFGSDGWAIAKGWASVTPLRASFAEAEVDGFVPAADLEGGVRKLRL